MRGRYAQTPAELEPELFGELRGGDVVMVKGSKSTYVSRIVTTLKERYPREAAHAEADM